MVNLKRSRAQGQLKGNLLQFTQCCLKAWPQILHPEGLSQHSENSLSAPESPARFHREEMLGNLLLPISKFIADDFTPANAIIQVFTEENNALHCTQKPTDWKPKQTLCILFCFCPRGKLIFS